MGFVLVNFARGGQLLHSTLESTERPMAIVLLIFAGALWQPTPLVPNLLGLGGFLIARTGAKWLASVIAGWGTSLRKDLFRGLLAHGDVTLAMAVSFRLVYDGEAAKIAYTVVLALRRLQRPDRAATAPGLARRRGRNPTRAQGLDSQTSIEVSAR